MSIQLSIMSGVMLLAHCQEVTLAIIVYIAIGNVSPGFPSGSSTAPPNMSPTTIAAVVASAPSLQNVTLPISSSLVTLTLTVFMASLVPSLAFTITM